MCTLLPNIIVGEFSMMEEEWLEALEEEDKWAARRIIVKRVGPIIILIMIALFLFWYFSS
jgi:hypothetical protein